MAEIITAKLVKDLRERTNVGIMDCKRALAEADGNMAEAENLLRKKGVASAEKKSSRIAQEGVIASYIHLKGKVGVLVEVNCESDFVATNETFREFVKDITLHIAASHPIYLNRGEVPVSSVENERKIYAAQVQGKLAILAEKIVEGRMDKFYSTVCLLEQAFVKSPDLTIQELVNTQIAKLGENIVIRRFVRYMVGESLA